MVGLLGGERRERKEGKKERDGYKERGQRYCICEDNIKKVKKQN